MIKLFLCSLLVLIHASAAALELRGSFVQGGLIIGRTSPDAQVSYNKINLKVSSEGYFVFGLSRDAPAKSELSVRFANGFSEVEPIIIQQRQYDEQHITGLPKDKVEPSEKDLERIWAEQKLINKARAREDTRSDFLDRFIWPVRGRISGVFGSRRVLNGIAKRPHSGLDIAAPEGTTVVAPVGGIVTLVHQDMFFTGGTLFIQHGHGISSMYIHLSKILVTEGQEVRQGQAIAEVGMTGRATGPHLHWGINWFNTKIDPQLLLAEMPRNKPK